MLALKTSYTKELATLESKYKRGRRVIPLWQVINHNISKNTKEILGDKMTQDFSSEVYLLAGKLVPVMEIHPLEGS
jgi:hypothetical protein